MKDLDVEAARAVAFRFLGYSARTRAEIEQRLARDEYDPSIVAAVIAELEGLGYLDDAGFARHWVEDRADRKRYGKVRLAAELKRKGVDRDTADEALGEIADDDEVRRAAEAARSRWSGEGLAVLDAVTLQKEKSRIAGFLQRRGFSWQTIKKVLNEMMENNR